MVLLSHHAALQSVGYQHRLWERAPLAPHTDLCSAAPLVDHILNALPCSTSGNHIPTKSSPRSPRFLHVKNGYLSFLSDNIHSLSWQQHSEFPVGPPTLTLSVYVVQAGLTSASSGHSDWLRVKTFPRLGQGNVSLTPALDH